MLRRSAVLALLYLLVAVTSVVAQDPRPSVQPPVLQSQADAVRPIGRDDFAGAVVLSLTIDPTGGVTAVEVVEPLDPDFDAAATEAARQFHFQPAMRGTQAIPARIRFRYVFRPVPIELSPAEDPYAGITEVPPGILIVRAIDGSNAPLNDVQVVLRTDAGTRLEVATDATGVARFDGLETGVCHLLLEREGFESRTVDESCQRGEELSVTFRLDPEVTGPEQAPTASYEATAEAEPPPRDATRRVLEAEVLTRIPGTRGDALRAVELLPGVGRPSFGGGNLIIRGSAPGDSQVFLDGNPVPLLYHFGGITSFYNSLMLERIEFVPGNFSVRYGRKIGGILEVTPRDPRGDRFRGFVDLNVIDASLMIEGPILPNLTFALSARRSYIDFFFTNVIPREVFNTLAAPVYYDYQAALTWRANAQNRLRLNIYGSSDELALIFSNPSDANPNVRGNLSVATAFHRVQLSWLHTEGDNFEIETLASLGVNTLNFSVGELVGLNSNFVPGLLRTEARHRLSDRVRVIAGLDMVWTPGTLRFRGPQIGQSEGSPGGQQSGGQTARVDQTFTFTAYRPAIYVETNLKPWDPFELVLGVRADYYREIQDWSVDPRLTARYRPRPDLQIRGGVGMFSQPPEFQESALGLGNPQLEPLHAIHASLGSEWRPADTGFQLTLDGFYKHLYDRVVATAGSAPPFFENRGLGRIYGLEVAARLNPGTAIPLFGFVSYTLSRSERQDNAAANWRLFDFDQTHILTAAVVWTIGSGWEAGVTFRLVSGNPVTPIVGAVNDVGTGSYQPIYGLVNSARNPMFHRLDARIQKLFQFGDIGLRVYLDVQNVYNQANPEGYQYNYDYSQQAPITGLPILPSLGIRGEL